MNFMVSDPAHPIQDQRPPDNLVGSLIAHKPGGAVRKVIRDDGDNGIWISHPGMPSSMYKIPREEYRSDWVFYKHEAQIGAEDLQGYSFDSTIGKRPDVSLDQNVNSTTARLENKPMPREETDREAMKEEILSGPPADVTSDGDPIAANEDPFDPDRADEDAAAEEPAPAPKRSRKSKDDEEA